MLKAVREFETYIGANRTFTPNYGDRYRHGETISTAFVESAVNQVLSKRFVKRQLMRWTERGAYLLLQVRTKVLNEHWRATVSRWYPGMSETSDTKAAYPRFSRSPCAGCARCKPDASFPLSGALQPNPEVTAALCHSIRKILGSLAMTLAGRVSMLGMESIAFHGPAIM